MAGAYPDFSTPVAPGASKSPSLVRDLIPCSLLVQPLELTRVVLPALPWVRSPTLRCTAA